jgi:hypothetical protein
MIDRSIVRRVNHPDAQAFRDLLQADVLPSQTDGRYADPRASRTRLGRNDGRELKDDVFSHPADGVGAARLEV